MDSRTDRELLVDAMNEADARGLNRGTSGNASIRTETGFLVTPSAVPPIAMTVDSIVEMTMDGPVAGQGAPSSEWRIHRDLYRSRPDAAAIVHTHSAWATALAALRVDLPAVHYTIAMAGTDTIRCAKYATFGTDELSSNAQDAIGEAKACLLASHGVIALEATLRRALDLAIEIEHLSKIYILARSAGTPVILEEREISHVRAQLDKRES